MNRLLAYALIRIRDAARPGVWRLGRLHDLDRKSVADRLRALGGPSGEVSGIFQPANHERPNGRLWEIAHDLIPLAQKADLPLLRKRGAPEYVHLWPGEHYRLLVALVQLLRPKVILEIGTFRGHSALAMLPELAPGAKLVTMDLISWVETPGCLLRREDFSSGRLEQVLTDIGNRTQAEAQAQTIRSADLIFVDAAKDGVLERKILENLAVVGLKPGVIVAFDDIRLWNMLAIWREIARPKIDLTSLGHYSGTGLIDWSGSMD